MKLRKLNNSGFSHHFLLAFVIVGVAVVGTFLLVKSHANPLPALPSSFQPPGNLNTNAATNGAKFSLDSPSSATSISQHPQLTQHKAVKPYKASKFLPSEAIKNINSNNKPGSKSLVTPQNETYYSGGTYFNYAGGLGFPSSQVGMATALTMNIPHVAPGDAHSLAEMAVESSDGRQIIEVGWTVDNRVASDGWPRLFTFHWVNGTPSCYDGCGWVQTSGQFAPGQPVWPDGGGQWFDIYYYQGNWWIGFANQWMGYFPGSLWSASGVNFTHFNFTQVFGEVASAQKFPCSQMTNGQYGQSRNSGAYAGTYYFGQGTSIWANLWQTPNNSDPYLYNTQTIPSPWEGAWFGGPGYPAYPSC